MNESWDMEINDLVKFFETSTLPSKPVSLKPGETIIDVQKFVNSHLRIVQAKNGVRTFLPYLNRLQELREYIITNSD